MMLGLIAAAALRSFVLVAVFGVVLAVFRIRDSRMQSATWRAALVASLLMPALMQIFVIPVGPLLAGRALSALPVATTAAVANKIALTMGGIVPTLPTVPAAISWLTIAWWLYVGIAALLILRLLAGLVLTWRMAHIAKPVQENWVNGLDARSCAATSVPVTFGSIVLLPESYVEWPTAKQRAVVIHECSHVENGDFYIQILASLNRAIFWFNPAAWWLHTRLTTLAEHISDDAALEVVADRPNYAEVLLDMSNFLHKAPAGVAMARPSTVKSRIERILASTTLTSRLNWGKRALLTAFIVPLAALTAMNLVPSAAAQDEPKIVSVSAALLESYVGAYQFDADTPVAGLVLTVTREGDHLGAQLSGQSKSEIFPSGSNEFFNSKARASFTFVTDEQGKVTGLVLHQSGLNPHATKTTSAVAASVRAATEQKLAEQQKPHQVASIDPKLLDGYIGSYRLSQTFAITITREGDQLFAQGTDQPKAQIYPYGPNEFFFTVVAAQLTFVTGADGRATELVLHQSGRDKPAPRIE
jgi:beta-lactamase regulating signal transducer with metallopeptidase domain